VLSIGNFDGIHRGHQQLLAEAHRLREQSGAPMVAAATFEPHPLTVLRPEIAPPRLTTLQRKLALLEEARVDALVVLPPSRQVLDLTAEQFWTILRDSVRPSFLIEGSSFNFGKGRGGSIEKLREWSAGTSVQLRVVEPVSVALLDLLVVSVSSSLIRWLLAYGRVRDAAICLGRPYELRGRVVAGAGRGRELGVPTANLECEPQLIPADGVYAGRCLVGGTSWPAAVSIGTNPTFGENPRTVEAHLIGFTGDLYNQSVALELIDWQREQQVFGNIDELKDRIARDIDESALRSQEDPARPIAQAVAGRPARAERPQGRDAVPRNFGSP